MNLLKRLFGGPPDTLTLLQRGDSAGLIAALGHTLPWVRRDAALALGELKDPQARAALTAALNDHDGDARRAAHDALAQLNDPQDIQRH